MPGKDGRSEAPSRTSIERVSDRELVTERTFNGPARIVFDAWTRADLVAKWWAPKSLGVSIVSVDADVRVGGAYRYVLNVRNVNDFAFSGKYLEVTPHTRLVYTTFYEPDCIPPASEDEAVMVTVTFDERGGKTHLVAREVYPSKEILDAAIASGMESGAHITMDQLDELVASTPVD
jgi:uncharacterized protein YndB with AHSA1/START domain